MKKILIFLIILLVMMTGCSSEAKSPAPEKKPEVSPLAAVFSIEQRDFKIGTAGFVPKNWPEPQQEDWNDFFAKLPEFGELYGVHVGWDVKLTEENIPEQVELVYQVTKGKPVTPYIALGFEPDRMTVQEADSYFKENGEDFKKVVLAVAKKHKPYILILGVEGNRFYEKSPKGYNDFVNVYKEIYDEVKKISPDTMMATNFQLEYMKGEAYLSGKEHVNHYDIIELFGDRMDLVTVTTYPWFDYNNPQDIPEDYLEEISQYSTKPLLITETGWPSHEFPVPSVEADSQTQVDYLVRMVELTKGIDTVGIVWVFPHDAPLGIAGGIFDHISLLENDGREKEVYKYWQALKSLTP